jgi:hypothetical protein
VADGADCYVNVIAVQPLERIDLIRSGSIEASASGEERLRIELGHTLVGIQSGEYVYVRAVQTDGGAAWGSPVFFEAVGR